MSSAPGTPTPQTIYSQVACPASPGRSPAVFKYRISRNFPRSKNGCLTCRSRRKKCDESRPICLNCSKSKNHCVWSQPLAQENQAATIHRQNKNSESEDIEVHSSLPRTTILARKSKNIKVNNTESQNVSKRILHSSSPFMSISNRPWYKGLSVSLSQSPRLDSSASLLFNHYISETAHSISFTPNNKNPFLHLVLPLAFTDQSIMNCVLAIGGAHLRFDKTLSAETESATWSHHLLVIRDLQVALSQGSLEQEKETLRMLLIILLLCMVESISGNSLDTLLHHLQAGRQLVLSMISKPKGIQDPELRDLWGFLLEMYAYMVLISTVTPSGNPNGQNLTLDSFLYSVEGLSQYGTYGAFFGSGQGIFDFIPEVSLLSSDCRVEEESGTISVETYIRYKDLESRIRSWTPPLEQATTNTELAVQMTTASLIYQTAQLIFLHSSFHKSIQDDEKLIAEIDIRIEMAVPLLASLSFTPLSAIILWPAMIIGSCVRETTHRDLFSAMTARYKMNAVKRAGNLLELLWNDPDPRAYGPRGLDYVMRKQGSNICMI